MTVSAHHSGRQSRCRVYTRYTLIRIGILLALAAAFVVWAWQSMIRMPLKSYTGPWVPLTAEETVQRNRLREHVEMLAGRIGERNVLKSNALSQAEHYIQSSLTHLGYEVERQSYRVQGVDCANLIAERSGGQNGSEIVVVGAHYDSVLGCPGANDNGSAVAAMLVLAESFRHAQPTRTLRLVAFANEEPPFFQTEMMGSLVYAQRCRQRGEQVNGMISLETMGYYSNEPGSQQYPFPVGLFYPSTGNFIGFVGDRSSAKLVRRCVATFRQQVQFPSEGCALPGWMPGIGWSDHWSFWQMGYPALMVTDTAPFRYPHYHTTQDTPDKIDYERLARVVSGMEIVIRELIGM